MDFLTQVYKTNDLKLHFDKKIVNKNFNTVKIYIFIKNEGCSLK